MKNLYLLGITLFIIPLLTNAQNPLLNPSFETWTWYDIGQTMEYPISWSGDPGPFPCKSTDACNGTYSVLLTDSVYGVSTGGGVGVQQVANWTGTNPIGISFCYKYKSTPNDTAYFTAILSDNNAYTSYVMKGFNQDTSIWTQVSLFFATYSGPIPSAFTLTVGATCSNTLHTSIDYSQFKIDDINLIYTTGIDNINEVFEYISIYPNPCNGLFKIIKESTENVASIEISNVFGERIYFNNNITQKNSEIDISGFSKGVYFIKIYDGSKLYSKRIVVQ